MNNQNVSYTWIVLKNVFNPTFLFISLSLCFGSLITVGVVFGFYYALQGTTIVVGISLLSILTWNGKRKANESYFAKLVSVRSKWQKIVLKLIEGAIAYVWFILLMFFSLSLMIVMSNNTPIFSSLLFNNKSQYLHFSRIDVVSLLYVFTLEFLFLSGVCGVLSRIMRDSRNYYIVMVMLIMFILLFSCVLNMPYRLPTDINGIPTYNLWDTNKITGSFHNMLIVKWFVLLNPQTHLNYLIGQQVYTLIFNDIPGDFHGFKVHDEMLRHIFLYGKSTEFAFSLYFPLAFGVIFKSVELISVK